MVSIIICSRSKKKNTELIKNITETIGNVVFEVIWIDNSENRYSIFQAYNEGVRLAKYQYLCFMHEDILFHSNNWGITAIDQMNDNKKIGMLGVIGGRYVSKYSHSWFTYNTMRYGKVIQGYKYHGKYKTKISSYLNNNQDKEVVTIDGLWMFIRHDLFDGKVVWDTKTFSGFHFYDMDISLQIVKAGYRIEIAPITIEHKSCGYYNKMFWDNYLLFHDKWIHFLPIGTSTFTEKDEIECDHILQKRIYNDKLLIIEDEEILIKTGYRRLQALFLRIKNKLKKKK